MTEYSLTLNAGERIAHLKKKKKKRLSGAHEKFHSASNIKINSNRTGRFKFKTAYSVYICLIHKVSSKH